MIFIITVIILYFVSLHLFLFWVNREKLIAMIWCSNLFIDDVCICFLYFIYSIEIHAKRAFILLFFVVVCITEKRLSS